jgi:DNA-binding transcriptional MerR regulator
MTVGLLGPILTDTLVLLAQPICRDPVQDARIEGMDNHMPIDEIARHLGISVATVRSYGERFALFLPVVRTGADLRYSPEGVTLLGEIDLAVQAGATFEEIEAGLQHHIPAAVVTFRDPAVDERSPAMSIEEVVRLLDEQRRAVVAVVEDLRTAIDRAATADQFHSLRAETASLAAVLAQRDSQLVHANAVIVAEVRGAFGVLRQEVADLHAEIHGDRGNGDADATPVEVETPKSETTADRPPDQPAKAPEPRRSSRTPRRMGQPLRLNGLAQN